MPGWFGLMATIVATVSADASRSARTPYRLAQRLAFGHRCLRLPPPENGVQNPVQLDTFEGSAAVVARARIQGIQPLFDVRKPAHHDDRQLGVSLPQQGEGLAIFQAVTGDKNRTEAGPAPEVGRILLPADLVGLREENLGELMTEVFRQAEERKT